MTKNRIKKIEKLCDMKYDGINKDLLFNNNHIFIKKISEDIYHCLQISTWFKYGINLYKINKKTTEVEELRIDDDIYKKLTNY